MNRVVITGIGCCTSLGWEQGGIARAFAGGCPAFAPSEALPGYSACPVSDLGDDAAYSRFSAWRHRRYLNRGAAFAVLSGLRAAASAGFMTRIFLLKAYFVSIQIPILLPYAGIIRFK